MVFEHSPLDRDQIRLVRLFRGNNPQNTKCELISVRLGDAKRPKYPAISYCWGDPKPRNTITLNGEEYKVTDSVHELFLALLPRTIGWMWIDAICINQYDNEEKNQQIPLMTEIYSKTRMVYVWLGPEADNSAIAMDFLQVLLAELPKLERSSDGSHFAVNKMTADGGDPKWIAMAHLFDRPWFHRVWVIQEVALSQNRVRIHCGNKSFWWSDTWTVLAHLDRLQMLSSLDVRAPEEIGPFTTLVECAAFRQMRHISYIVGREEQGDPIKLQLAIMASNIADATNPRDHLYGIYGLVADSRDEALKPDYNKPVEEVYIQTTRHIMTRDKSLILLYDAGIYHPSRLPTLPSWVPNYNVPRGSTRLDIKGYHAAGNIEPKMEWDDSTSNLTVSGIILDSIELMTLKSLSIVHMEPNDTARVFGFFNNVLLLVKTYNSAPKFTSNIDKETTWRTLLANRVRHSTGKEVPGKEYGDQYEGLEYFISHLDEFSNLYISEWYTTDPEKVEKMDIYKKALQFFLESITYIPGRRVAATMDGRLALVPLSTCIEDKLCVIMGTPAPLIVRPVVPSESGEEKFSLVGECYAHGLMYGEALELGEMRDIVLQ